jgi:hypothetical protein
VSPRRFSYGRAVERAYISRLTNVYSILARMGIAFERNRIRDEGSTVRPQANTRTRLSRSRIQLTTSRRSRKHGPPFVVPADPAPHPLVAHDAFAEFQAFAERLSDHRLVIQSPMFPSRGDRDNRPSIPARA